MPFLPTPPVNERALPKGTLGSLLRICPAASLAEFCAKAAKGDRNGGCGMPPQRGHLSIRPARSSQRSLQGRSAHPFSPLPLARAWEPGNLLEVLQNYSERRNVGKAVAPEAVADVNLMSTISPPHLSFGEQL